ncbi:hypothetical protein H696_01206 [Fonticula alba]|uniref:Uncharacterized protein n=1 Tax=Fonticula alba TaxID=691883 RepID=A0A058ZCY0_FONAL|nr:hypothetical protein H696_01206 [Fonticula alba]KCV71788.1 hypothetical protein H696_01206 [Fonticula alba]|eukprot:XP_009493366.1 hypothetical protein H696_01206 [Fonticula alba]
MSVISHFLTGFARPGADLREGMLAASSLNSRAAALSERATFLLRKQGIAPFKGDASSDMVSLFDVNDQKDEQAAASWRQFLPPYHFLPPSARQAAELSAGFLPLEESLSAGFSLTGSHNENALLAEDIDSLGAAYEQGAAWVNHARAIQAGLVNDFPPSSIDLTLGINRELQALADTPIGRLAVERDSIERIERAATIRILRSTYHRLEAETASLARLPPVGTTDQPARGADDVDIELSQNERLPRLQQARSLARSRVRARTSAITLQHLRIQLRGHWADLQVYRKEKESLIDLHASIDSHIEALRQESERIEASAHGPESAEHDTEPGAGTESEAGTLRRLDAENRELLGHLTRFIRSYYPPPTAETLANSTVAGIPTARDASLEAVPSLSILLEDLMNRTILHPEDPFISTAGHWPPYVELLLRSGIATTEQANSQTATLSGTASTHGESASSTSVFHRTPASYSQQSADQVAAMASAGAALPAGRPGRPHHPPQETMIRLEDFHL